MVQNEFNFKSKREEAEILFIQLHRTLVLWAIGIYSLFQDGPWQDVYNKRIPQLFYVKSDKEIDNLLSWIKSIRARWLIRFAYWLHLKLDRSKRLKEFLLTLFFWCRFAIRKVFPERQFGNYKKWYTLHEKNLAATSAKLMAQFGKWPERPKFCIVFHEGTLAGFESFYRSLLSQTYQDWQVVIFSKSLLQEEWVKAIAKSPQSEKIKVYYEQEIAGQFKILMTTEAQYFLFIRSSGLLASEALTLFTERIYTQANEKLFYYGDEDLIDEAGNRKMPRFYPQWDFDFHLAQNLFRNYFGLSKTGLELIVSLNLFDQSLDFQLLKATALLDCSLIEHIPEVLFHVSSSHSNNPTLWPIVVEHYLKATLPQVAFRNSPQGWHQILWPLPEPKPEVSLIIPTKDRIDLLEVLMNGLLHKTTYPIKEIIVVDNQSQKQESLKYFKQLMESYKNVTVLKYDHPFNYSAINNFGVLHATGTILGFLNNDLEIINSDWLGEMIRQIARPNVGAVGAKLYYKNNFIQHAGVVMGISQVAGHVYQTNHRTMKGYCDRLTFVHSYSAVTGACLFTRRSVFESVKGFNETDLAVAYNDVDLCLKIQELGYRVLWTPFAELYHYESATRPVDTQPQQLKRYRSEIRYMRDRWRKQIEEDPHYHPYLARDRYEFQLHMPPVFSTESN